MRKLLLKPADKILKKVTNKDIIKSSNYFDYNSSNR